MIGLMLAAAVACVRQPNPPHAVQMGAPAYLEACNVAPAGWQPMSTAPRDGSVIEIRNSWGGYGPFYSRNRWDGNWWVDATPRPPCHDPEPVALKDKRGKVIGMEATSTCFTSGYGTDAEAGLAWRRAP